MRLEWRLKIAKIRPLHQLARVVMYNSGWFYYKKKYYTCNYRKTFMELKGSGYGKRCFIIGNGPSLAVKDLNALKKEDCFASNGIFNIFSNTSWRPTYYIVMDRYCDVTPEMVRDMNCKLVFLGDYYCRFNKVLREDAICLHQHYPFSIKSLSVSQDISKRINSAFTVSFSAMQVAAYLGYKEIYLLGFDNNYDLEIAENREVIRTGATAHFYKDEEQKEPIANILGMVAAYKIFKKYADSHEITIKNATRGGKLEVFDRVDFDSLFINK